MDVNKDAPNPALASQQPDGRHLAHWSKLVCVQSAFSARAGADRLGRSCCVGTGKQHRLCLRLQENGTVTFCNECQKHSVGRTDWSLGWLNAEDCAIEERGTVIYECTSLLCFFTHLKCFRREKHDMLYLDYKDFK